jgi:hypothetical protein
MLSENDPDHPSQHHMPGILPCISIMAAAAWLSVAGLYQTAQSLAWLWAIITQP